MNYRRLGRSGLKVSEVCLGAWINFGDRIADEASLSDRERVLVWCPRDDAEALRKVCAGHDRDHARERLRAGRVDVMNARVRMR